MESMKKFYGVVTDIIQKEKSFNIHIRDPMAEKPGSYWLSKQDVNASQLKVGDRLEGEFEERDWEGKVMKWIRTWHTETEKKEFRPANEVPTGRESVDYGQLLDKCIKDVIKITGGEEGTTAIKWSTEDLRTFSISLFIQRSRV